MYISTSQQVPCFRPLKPDVCSWLMEHLKRKYPPVMEASVHGRRSVSGLTGLVRYHCETVMGSMVASSLDSVDTSPRPDLVSRGVYTRFHAPLADMLAIFTETLSLMLSGNFYLLSEVNYVTTLNIQDRLSELTV